jgi:O-antigen ligase/polysaccharide polymerase Wzy-like membrane protein
MTALGRTQVVGGGQMLVGGLICAATGALVTVRPAAAVACVGAAAFACIAARTGWLGLGCVLVAALPFCVVLLDLLPALFRTLWAFATAVVVALAVAPDAGRDRAAATLRAGIVLLFIPTGVSLLLDPAGQPLVQAAKYTILPLGAIAVVMGRDREAMRKISAVAFVAATAAVTLQFAFVVFRIGNVGTYYGSGEVLGFGNPHEISLLAVAVTIAALASPVRGPWRMAVVAIGGVVVVYTGVRAGVIALVLVSVLLLALSRVRLRVAVLLGVATSAVIASGASLVIADRLHHSAQTREFASFSTAGSGRGEIWDAAVDRFVAGTPVEWALGTGLRTITRFSEAALGGPFVGHSDIIEVGVQLGLIGLAGLLLMWFAVLSSGAVPWPFVAVIVFGVLNGSLEYSAALLVALCLSPARYAGIPRSSRRRS